MHPFHYHEGQRAIQREANSLRAADKLSTWVGPVTAYALEADLIVVASAGEDALSVAAVSGPAPLATVADFDREITVTLPDDVSRVLDITRSWGGIVINLATARRSRIAGSPLRQPTGIEIPCAVAFTNCRKYMTPSSSTGDRAHVGPTTLHPCAFDDPWLVETIAQGETAFLVTVTPDGVADVSHRGGPSGFLRYDHASATIAWTEYLGDGMFVSTGNIRSESRFALVVLDFATGGAVRLDCVGRYTNVRADRQERVDALIQANEPFPVQGQIEATVVGAARLEGFCHPRIRVGRRTRITAADSTAVQHPQ